jgi:hypothetical protein
MSRLDYVHAFRRIPPKCKAPSQFPAAAVHLGGTRLHPCGSPMLAERLQSQVDSRARGKTTSMVRREVDCSSPSEGSRFGASQLLPLSRRRGARARRPPSIHSAPESPCRAEVAAVVIGTPGGVRLTQREGCEQSRTLGNAPSCTWRREAASRGPPPVPGDPSSAERLEVVVGDVASDPASEG